MKLPYPLNQLRWPNPIEAGMLVLLTTVIGVAFVLAGLDSGALTRYEGQIWIGVLSIFATISLAMGIYIQAEQNTDLIEHTETQTSIIRESEWFPQVNEDLGNERFTFNNNPPIYPEIRIDLEDVSTDWMPHFVDQIASQWIVELRYDDIKQRLNSLECDEYEGRLTLKYESITGGEYEFRYPVSIHIREFGEYAISAHRDVDRELPWDKQMEKDEDG